MTGNNVKIDNFVFDYFEDINNSSDMKKTEQIFNILINCSYNSKYKTLDKRMFTLHFTDEQLSLIKIKQKELGYENNLSRFVRYALFDFYMKEHNIELINNKFVDKLISYNKFRLLCDKCKDELLNGKYTSYNLDLLRDNKKYEDKISFFDFNDKTKEMDFNIDFLEYDMLVFLNFCFENKMIYSDLIGLPTEQFASNEFMKMEDGSSLEEFIDYDNIVPNIDSFYYLFLYYAFVKDPEELNIDEIFDETDEHIDLLLKKYSFSKIVKYFKEKHDITNTYNIFDKKCIKILLLNNVIIPNDIVEVEDAIEADETTELENIIESDDIIESNEIVEYNETIESNENIDTK